MSVKCNGPFASERLIPINSSIPLITGAERTCFDANACAGPLTSPCKTLSVLFDFPVFFSLCHPEPARDLTLQAGTSD